MLLEPEDCELKDVDGVETTTPSVGIVTALFTKDADPATAIKLMEQGEQRLVGTLIVDQKLIRRHDAIFTSIEEGLLGGGDHEPVLHVNQSSMMLVTRLRFVISDAWELP